MIITNEFEIYLRLLSIGYDFKIFSHQLPKPSAASELHLILYQWMSALYKAE